MTEHKEKDTRVQSITVDYDRVVIIGENGDRMSITVDEAIHRAAAVCPPDRPPERMNSRIIDLVERLLTAAQQAHRNGTGCEHSGVAVMLRSLQRKP